MFLFVQLLFRGERDSGCIAPNTMYKATQIRDTNWLDTRRGRCHSDCSCSVDVAPTEESEAQDQLMPTFAPAVTVVQSIIVQTSTYTNACIVISVCIHCNALLLFIFNSGFPCQDFLCEWWAYNNLCVQRSIKSRDPKPTILWKFSNHLRAFNELGSISNCMQICGNCTQNTQQVHLL
jgi:hypothetical protein